MDSKGKGKKAGGRRNKKGDENKGVEAEAGGQVEGSRVEDDAQPGEPQRSEQVPPFPDSSPSCQGSEEGMDRKEFVQTEEKKSTLDMPSSISSPPANLSGTNVDILEGNVAGGNADQCTQSSLSSLHTHTADDNLREGVSTHDIKLHKDFLVQEKPSNRKGEEGSILRDDEECFLADYTKSVSGVSGSQLVLLQEPVRAWIARELVEMDEDVCLAIRCGPGIDEKEVGVVTANDHVVIVGQKGEWALLEGEPSRFVLAYRDGQPLLRIRPQPVTSATAVKMVSTLASSAWKYLSSAADPDVSDVDGRSGCVQDSISDVSTAPAKEIQVGKKESANAAKPLWGGGGWGFGGLVSSITAGASTVASNILKAGADTQEQAANDDAHTKVGADKHSDGECSDASKDLTTPSITDGLTTSITDGIDKRFAQDVKLDEGGISSVRYVAQGITLIESSLGWLGSTASATINQQNVDALVDKAWSGVKEGVHASSVSLSSAVDVAQHASLVAQQAAQHTASGLKDRLTTGKKLLSEALGTRQDAHRPNLELGGALGIQLCGTLLPRITLPEEDADPLLEKDLELLKPLPFAIKAVAALVHERFQEDVFLYAVASAGVQARMLRWLAVHNVYEQTGLSRERVHLCREEDEQADVCRQLNLSHVIEVSDKGAEVVRSAVADVLVLGDGKIYALVDKSAEGPVDDKHSQDFEAWWGAALEHLLPIEPQSPSQSSTARQDACVNDTQDDEAVVQDA